MMTAKVAVRKLVDVAYNSGYYSGKGEDRQPHHTRAIRARNALIELVTAHLDDKDARIALLESEVALLTPEALDVKALVDACSAFVEAWEKSHQLEKTDVALRMAKSALEAFSVTPPAEAAERTGKWKHDTKV